MTMSTSVAPEHHNAPAVLDKHIQHVDRLYVNDRGNKPVTSGAVYANRYTSVHHHPPPTFSFISFVESIFSFPLSSEATNLRRYLTGMFSYRALLRRMYSSPSLTR